ncbi:hypothetical protein [Paenibacillus lemnae]|uniref:Uncharacterized protein n=1 Tax=Paenibacillus lemnae TaxID=1330551 RepID=A0A848M199_PAELE|nr:hypothetical protein [Paenibacillus lemnae]NMO94708.1 hypothetical protein [Paenibacillus lemnae]
MSSEQQQRISTRIIAAAMLLFPLLSGCSISGRGEEHLPVMDGPASPVHKDVYDRSVQEEVYSSGSRVERLIQEPTLELEPPSPLRDK